nr:hypothetical protein Iba_chr06bCG13400 [Ipomoea batatas]
MRKSNLTSSFSVSLFLWLFADGQRKRKVFRRPTSQEEFLVENMEQDMQTKGTGQILTKWFNENHAKKRELTPPPREHRLSQRDVDIALGHVAPHQPHVEDYDEDYLRYLQEIPEEEKVEKDYHPSRSVTPRLFR